MHAAAPASRMIIVPVGLSCPRSGALCLRSLENIEVAAVERICADCFGTGSEYDQECEHVRFRALNHFVL